MAIALCRDWVFASDDGAARRFAQAQQIKLTGTLGILIKATKSDIITQADADIIHRLMIDEGYRSPLPYENGISGFLNR
jgi:predicted nucleic acid-binding protein